MKRYKTILFDLDGTLLPMDQNRFLELYFSTLAEKMQTYGYPPEKLMQTTQRCVRKVMENADSTTNEAQFAAVFAEAFPEKIAIHEKAFLEYYTGDFLRTKEACGCTADAQIVRELKQRGQGVVLATSPLFPRVATEARIRWAGLEPEDFDYITTYENCSTCKPNPRYYGELCQKLDLCPEETLMVGNDAVEDIAAEKIGLDVFLLTPCLLNGERIRIEEYPHGTFADLRAFLGLR